MSRTQGTLTTNGQAVTLVYRPTPGAGLTPSARNNGGVGVQITGTWTGTLSFEGTIDGTNFGAIQATRYGTGATASSTTENSMWRAEVVGLTSFRVRASAAMTGSAVVTIVATEG